jgi:hypothetical protein
MEGYLIPLGGSIPTTVIHGDSVTFPWPSSLKIDDRASGVKQGDIKELQEYNKNHVACPQCFSKSVWQTCMGCLWLNEKYKDTNRARCSNCDFVGIVDDLVPERSSNE